MQMALAVFIKHDCCFFRYKYMQMALAVFIKHDCCFFR